MLRYQADVVVIGSGHGRRGRRHRAARSRPARAALDRDAEENMGGLAKESFGGLWFAGTPLQRRYGIRDGAEQGLRDWHAFAEFGPGDRWPRAWAEAYVQRANEEIFDWLRGVGVQFMPMPLWVERGLHTPGNSVPRWHIVWGTGHELAVVLNRRLLCAPAPGPARAPLRASRRVARRHERPRDAAAAVRWRAPDRNSRHSGDSVVIAAGGINGDLARVRANWHADWGRPPETILNGSHKYADGRLHDAASALGRQHHAPRLAVELRRRRASLAAAQARARLVAGAAEVGVVAQLARRAHRPDAARDGIRHARPGRADLPAGARLFVAAAEPPHRAEGARDLRRRVQSGIPREEAPARRARHAAWQPLAVRRGDAQLPRTSSSPTRCRSWWKR